MGSVISEKIDEVIRIGLKGPLRELGFKKNGRTFARFLEDSLAHVINIQSWRYNQGDSGRFTVNLGVFVPYVYESWFGVQAPGHPRETACMIRERIGFVMDGIRGQGPRDVWWEINTGSDPAALAESVGMAILDYGIPYLNQFNSMDSVIHILERGSIDKLGIYAHQRELFLAIIYAHRGERRRAQQIFNVMFPAFQGHPFGETLEQIAGRLNLAVPQLGDKVVGIEALRLRPRK